MHKEDAMFCAQTLPLPCYNGANVSDWVTHAPSVASDGLSKELLLDWLALNTGKERAGNVGAGFFVGRKKRLTFYHQPLLYA